VRDLIFREKESRTDALKGLLHGIDPLRPVMVTSYQTFSRLVEEGGLPNDMSDVFLCGDEGHHAAYGANSEDPAWSRARSVCVEHGATWLTATATADMRHDGKPVVEQDGAVYVPTSDVVEAGRRPRITCVRTHSIRAVATWDAATASAETANEPTGILTEDEDFWAMANAWKQDGFPRAVFRVQSTNVCSVKNQKGTTQPAQLIRALKAADPSLRDDEILDATGSSEERKRVLRRALQDEENASSLGSDGVPHLDLHKSKIKAVIAVQRFVEGTDWPFCSHVYVLGLPASLGFIIQLIGRAQRPKRDILNFAQQFPEFVEVATCTFFLPKITDVARHRRELSELSTLIGLVQEDQSLGGDAPSLARFLREEIRKVTGSRATLPPWQRVLEKLFRFGLGRECELTEFCSTADIELTALLGRKPSAGEFVDHVVRSSNVEKDPITALQRVLVILLHLERQPNPPSKLRDEMERLARLLVKMLSAEGPEETPSPSLPPTPSQTNRSVLEQFAAETLSLLRGVAHALGPAAVSFADNYVKFAMNLDHEFLKQVKLKAEKTTRYHVDEIVGPIFALVPRTRSRGYRTCPEDLGVLMQPPRAPGTFMRSDLLDSLERGAVEGMPPKVRTIVDFEKEYKIRLRLD
jgi:hypothetical protein